VTGVLTNRCILKGSVHARMFDYTTYVVKDATGGQIDAERWSRAENGAPQLHELRGQDLNWQSEDGLEGLNSKMDLLAQQLIVGFRKDEEWKENIYFGKEPKGGPSLKDTWSFLLRSEVIIAKSAADFRPGGLFNLDNHLTRTERRKNRRRKKNIDQLLANYKKASGPCLRHICVYEFTLTQST